MKKWEIINQEKISSSEIADLIHLLLKNRGLKTDTEIEEFLHPRLETVTPSSVGIDKKDLQKSLERIKQAIDQKERIIIFGDYDVDGITGTAILWETLHTLKANVMPYIPNRIDEGYGLSLKGLENVIQKYPNTKLIITVDNGIMAHEAVEAANSQGLQVIITDHHTPEGDAKQNPKAFSIVHTTAVCGAGVAYLLSQELFQLISPDQMGEWDRYLELATLGTIADLVPLTKGSRAIVKIGLEKLCKTKRPGLLALFQEAACNKSVLGVYEVGHIIAPRLNAAGRLESAMDSLRLLCTTDMVRAQELALQIGLTNTKRQEIMKDSVSHASLSVRTSEKGIKKLIFIGDADYQPGVIGLIAGRLVEEFYHPAIVLSIGEKYAKASVRSVSGFNIIEFLRKKQELFVNLGGHPMAAGFTVETVKIDKLQTELEEMGEELLTEELLTRRLCIDCELPLKIVTKKFYDELKSLSPFGMGNPEPTFVSRLVTIDNMRLLGREGKHLQLIIHQDGSAKLEAIAFGMGELAQELHIGDQIDIAYTVDENEWNGNKKMQLKIKDIQGIS